VRVEYFQSGGAASAHLEWSSLSQARQIIPASQVIPAFVDHSAPTAPTSLSPGNISEDSVALNWSPSSDDVGVAAYDVYRGSTKVGSTTGTTFSDTGLNASTTYQYSVRAVDGASRVSSSSGTLNVTTDAPPISHDAFSAISAGDFDGSSGVSKSGGNAVDFDDGDWIKFSNVNFGGGANSVRINIALPTSNLGGKLEFRLDSPSGPLIGSLATQTTGSFNTYSTKQARISGASGVHNLYVVGRNRSDLANVQSLQFRTQSLTRVMALGDSITQQFSTNTTWRYYLWHKLLDAGKNVDFVGPFQSNTNGYPPNPDFDQDHAGISGIRADEVLQQVGGWASAAQPDVVLIHLGTNDLRQGQSPSSTINDISGIIDVLRSVNPNVKIILAKIIPASDAPPGSVNDFNDLIPGLAAQKSTGQSPITVVDQNTGFSLNTDSDDGLHPNDNGDHKMADKWFNVLAPIVA
jgi:lysophospholipase L1-like esterase